MSLFWKSPNRKKNRSLLSNNTEKTQLLGIDIKKYGSLGNQMIGKMGDDQVIFDILNEKVVGKIGTPETIPDPEGDISLSPDGNWFVNGSAKSGKNFYNIVHLTDGEWTRTEGIDKGEFSGDVRIDSAPRWNRDNNQILVQGIADDGTEQLYIISIIEA